MRMMDITRDEYLALDRDVVVPVIPLGSIEQHGSHLPMGTDTYQVETIVARAEAQVSDITLLTPALWVGNSVNHLGFGAALYLDPTRYVTLLVDIGRSFLEAGFRHLFYFNGHGANNAPLVTALHQLEHDYIATRDDLQIAGSTWWALDLDVIREVRDSPLGAAGHACEIETSLMLAAHGDLVHKDRIVDGAHDHPHPDWGTYDFLGSSRAMFVEMFHRGAPNGVAGLPSLATADKGEVMIERMSTALVELLTAFSSW